MPDVTFIVDGEKLTAPAGTLLIDACRKAGIEIPAFCYYPGLSLQAACRMCVVRQEKCIREANSDQPENHQNQWQEAQQKKHPCFAHQGWKQLLPCQEYGRCGDEQSKAHAPKMPRQALGAGNPAAYQHAHVPYGSQQSHGTKEKKRPRRIFVLQPRWTSRRFYPKRYFDNSDRQDNEERAPIENARFPVATPGGEPRCYHQIER